jgi:hypothetical protein
VKKLCILLVFFLFLYPIHEVRIVSASESGKIIRTDDQLLYERIKNSSEQVNLIVVLNPLVKAESGFALLSHQVPLKLRYVYREVCHGLAVSTRGYHLRALLFSSLVEKIYLCQESFRVSRNRDAVSVKAEHVWKKLDHQKKVSLEKALK